MTDASDMITHYRVKLGSIWINAAAAGTAEAVRKRLNEDDAIWQREGVELVVSKPLDAWNGPFPKGAVIRFWATTED